MSAVHCVYRGSDPAAILRPTPACPRRAGHRPGPPGPGGGRRSHRRTGPPVFTRAFFLVSTGRGASMCCVTISPAAPARGSSPPSCTTPRISGGSSPPCTAGSRRPPLVYTNPCVFALSFFFSSPGRGTAPPTDLLLNFVPQVGEPFFEGEGGVLPTLGGVAPPPCPLRILGCIIHVAPVSVRRSGGVAKELHSVAVICHGVASLAYLGGDSGRVRPRGRVGLPDPNGMRRFCMQGVKTGCTGRRGEGRGSPPPSALSSPCHSSHRTPRIPPPPSSPGNPLGQPGPPVTC